MVPPTCCWCTPHQHSVSDSPSTFLAWLTSLHGHALRHHGTDSGIDHSCCACCICVAPGPLHTQAETLFKGHLLESETYIGGKVEALESGVFRSDLACVAAPFCSSCTCLRRTVPASFSCAVCSHTLPVFQRRSDLPTRFKCKPEAYQGLIDCLDRDLTYALQTEAKWELGDVSNYEEVKAEITHMLEALREAPNRCVLLHACVVLPLLIARWAACCVHELLCRQWCCGCCGVCAAGRRSL